MCFVDTLHLYIYLPMISKSVDLDSQVFYLHLMLKMVWPDLRFKTRNSNIFLLISVAIRSAWHEHLVRIDDIHLYTFQSDPYPGIGTASLQDDNSINYLVCNLGNFRENTGIYIYIHV